CFEKVLRTAPGNVQALVGLGQVAALEGHFDEARATLERALQIEPRTASAWAWLARLRRMTPADGAWLRGAEESAANAGGPVDEANIRYAIGKYYDDVGEYAQAFRSYQRANELQKKLAEPYQRSARASFVDDMIRLYPPESLSRRRPGASDSELPVFVVGMMRSGTSLVEQIIASHPAAKGAGELDFWSEVIRKHESAIRAQQMGRPDTERIAAAYLKALTAHLPEARRVVDKTTVNSDYLGLIHGVFPRARFIYLQRDPVDTCLSCYFEQLSTGLNFTMDLTDLAHYYRGHRRLVDHWRKALPANTLLDVPYEALINDSEQWSRRIVDFIGLEWDPRCLQFHRTERNVLTASFWQVRQKIYTHSVGRWRNYRKFIGPLLELQALE
ncbi:MAG TPA: sulfotransferase, partial [Steroidobacteraceae bacterium]|nr:sulfotransferase [Steroidobacteraceae bacterium]